MAVIAKYKFNSTLYADLIPEFNVEFTNYVVTDEATETDSEGNMIKTRVIEHDTLLPTLMRFGRIQVEGETATDNRTDSLLKILDINTSELTSCYSMFRYNTNLTSISCNWNTNNVTVMTNMFYECTNLTTLDVSNFNTSNVTSMSSMFYNCNNLTSLDVSNFDTNEVITMSSMFCMCKSLTSLDVSNWDTSNVTNMYSMFRECNNLTSLDVSNFNTKNVTNMYCLFDNCKSLTSLDVSNFDTSNVTTMYGMFAECKSLTSLDVSNFDTSNVTNMFWMFGGCKNLTSLDLSNFDTKNVTNMFAMFYNCNKLTSLDVSNFNISKVTNMDDIFSNTPLLKDIGILYCSQSTINALSSVISTPSTNVWVEGSMIDDLTSYDNVIYKAYYWEKEVLLNSPLLEGDKIVKKDGKLYHYHKMGKVVLDGSEDWSDNVSQPNENLYNRYIIKEDAKAPDGKIFSDNFKRVNNMENEGIKIGHYAPTIYVAIDKTKLSELNGNGFKQWFSENPTTVVYELANPYYELISDTSEDLSLSLVSEDNIISNNSLIPTNMNVKNNGMSTVAMNTSTKYTVAFDKDTDSSVTIDLCGSTIDTTDNVVEITTPSELINDEITFIGDCKVSNVRILEGSVSGDAIPKESFEGLKNSFEDGKLPNPLYMHLDEFTITRESSTWGRFTDSESLFTNNRVYTLFMEVLENSLNNVLTWEITQTYASSRLNVNPGQTGIFVGKVDAPGDSIDSVVWVSGANQPASGEARIGRCYALEGDWTHLTEEDWNNLGKYKVEYKVTGKNKFDGNLSIGSIHIENGEFGDNEVYKNRCTTDFLNVNPNTNYYRSLIANYSLIWICFYDKDKNYIGYHNETNAVSFTTPSNCKYIRFSLQKSGEMNSEDLIHIKERLQLEEGSTPTNYEPYKEYTKTFYLNSPLLEGDTIEDVNGVATHIKRYNKVVFDGSETWKSHDLSLTNTLSFFCYDITNAKHMGAGNSDRFIYKNLYQNDKESFYIFDNGYIYIRISKSKLSTTDLNGFKQWLQANPITVVYELASPIYKPISTESILCDSYVNGHLDVDSNIPVEKVEFRDWFIGLQYLQANTVYNIQFQSDNSGLIDEIKLGHWSIRLASNVVVSKGINVIKVTTPNELVINMLYIRGIGFNASNVQVVATERDNIGYFKGIQSSFEDCKKIKNENLFDGTIIMNSYYSSGFLESNDYHRTDYIECKPNTPYTSNCGTGINYFDENKIFLGYYNHNVPSPINAKYLIKNISVSYNDVLNELIIEEMPNGKYEVKVTLEDENGVISNEFIYLNSPLLKGDRIEMYNGKLCHYHKMGMVVLDGSEGDMSQTVGGKWYRTSVDNGATQFVYYHALKKVGYNTSICDKFLNTGNSDPFTSEKRKVFTYTDHPNLDRIYFNFGTSDTSMQEWLTWLSENPTTIVYELLEPYYEDITPIQNEFVITSIGESSFTIDSGAIPTDGEITYSVNVKLLNDLEESINNNTSSTDTDLSTILDDIINE